MLEPKTVHELLIKPLLVVKDMDVNEHERLSNALLELFYKRVTKFDIYVFIKVSLL